MSTAISVKTESGDHYLFAYEEDIPQQMINSTVEKELGEEYDYVTDVEVAHSVS